MTGFAKKMKTEKDCIVMQFSMTVRGTEYAYRSMFVEMVIIKVLMVFMEVLMIIFQSSYGLQCMQGWYDDTLSWPLKVELQVTN